MMVAMQQQLPAITSPVLQKQLPNATPEQAAQLNDFVKVQMKKMIQTMPWDDLMQAMIPAYQHHFTHGEMQELIHFYSTPLGRKVVAEMPAIMTEYMQASTPIMQKWMQNMMTDLQQSAAEYAKNLKQGKSPSTEPKEKAS
jgi:hypothetical protein